MSLRTDLALELREENPRCEGVSYETEQIDDITVSAITVEDERGARALGKPLGSYITIELPTLTDHSFLPDERYQIISDRIAALLPEEGLILTVGLGNASITPDALGPRAASQVIATRHIVEELHRSAGFDALRAAATIAPGVLGQTGIEVLELLRSLCKAISPAAVIIIDAMASRRLARLGCTVQISDAGISPGAGVGNNRPSISRRELGVPVISIGVPTVVEASTLAHDLTGGAISHGAGMIVTPREVDLLIERAARLLALSINSALHPQIDPLELLALA
ncbi:MAG: GPR endopeptidase [Clostridia bacterium]|nr:GPR endopeptidase [Clostridia bacterium]